MNELEVASRKYFPHSTSMHKDPRLLEVRKSFGNDAYVIYCTMKELMMESPSGMLNLKHRDMHYIYARACFAVDRVSVQQLNRFRMVINQLTKVGIFEREKWVGEKLLVEPEVIGQLMRLDKRRTQYKDSKRVARVKKRIQKYSNVKSIT